MQQNLLTCKFVPKISFFEKDNRNFKPSVHDITLTIGNNFFNHRADTLEVFCEKMILCRKIWSPRNLCLNSHFFEIKYWIFKPSVNNITLTTGNNFFNHRADTLDVFCEKMILFSEICSPRNLCLNSPFFEKINRIFKLSVQNIALTTGNDFFNHRADTLEVFCEKIILCSRICSPLNLCLKSHYFEKNNRIFKPSVNNIALTTGYNFFNHRADTLEMFCEKMILCRKICSPLNLCLKSHFFEKNIESSNRRYTILRWRQLIISLTIEQTHWRCFVKKLFYAAKIAHL